MRHQTHGKNHLGLWPGGEATISASSAVRRFPKLLSPVTWHVRQEKFFVAKTFSGDAGHHGVDGGGGGGGGVCTGAEAAAAAGSPSPSPPWLSSSS